MKNLWSDEEAAQYQGDLGLRVYTSRLLGRDRSLVLHGGGNTSVKIEEANIFGEPEMILYVKGSGWDLKTIETQGFSPVRMDHLLKLAKLRALSDPQMVNELKTHMTDAAAPSPSVETILHAILPYRYVDHTHADAVVSITNTPNGMERIQDIYGDAVVTIPYVMPGFDLARLCAERFSEQAHGSTIGMVLMNHGIFSFGDTAQQSYERMIDLVGRAEEYLKRKGAWQFTFPTTHPGKTPIRLDLCHLRHELSAAAGFPMILTCHREPKFLAFAQRDDLSSLSQQGPATPDHIIRTKRLPLLGRVVNAYVRAYQDYFNTYAPKTSEPKSMLDPAPRIVLDPDLGLVSAGRTAKDAAIVADIYDHTIDVILRATQLQAYRALPQEDLFEVEYWDLEQAKLRKQGTPPLFTGEVALITGAASGIGKACTQAMLRRGAAVIALDVNPEIDTLFDTANYCGINCDVTRLEQIRSALERGVQAFGGIDMLVLNAGIFPPGRRIEEISDQEWSKVLAINLDANLTFLRECYPFLKLAPRNGRVVIVGSKNVPAPGPGAAAYSASKAALNQLMRIAALEWGPDGIRINTVHPDAVFDTGIWTPEVLQSRAAHYGMSVEEYKRKNVLKTEISSHDVAELVAEMCGPLFAKTTAAQVPIDGGNERVI